MNHSMSRLISLVFVVCLILLQGTSTSLSQELRHIGKWGGKDEAGKYASIQFDQQGYAILFIDNEALGEKKDGYPTIKYEFNFSKNPIWLDFILLDPSGGELSRIRSIVKFLEGDRMLWQVSNNMAERPVNFDEREKGNYIVLKKVSQ